MSRLTIVALSSLALLAACGGGGSSSPTPSTPAPIATGPVADASPLSPAIAISVLPGQDAAGVNIVVPAPSSSPPPNAQVLGVAELIGLGSAANTGATISQGSIKRVLLFGPGLSANMEVTIGGPADIGISNLHAIQSDATPPTPGISFTATVSTTAAVGGRSVILRNLSNNDVTTFTGGLEVVVP